MATYYYNLTYRCQSACVFCASDSTNAKVANMNLLDVVKSFDMLCLNNDDEIILNGGETTLHPDLIRVVRLASQTGASVTLFTNGRRLADRQFTEQLIDSGVDRISIPFYGTDEYEHELMTQSRNSFRQTMSGVHNLLDIRGKNDSPELELKCLMCRPCLNKNSGLVDFVAREFGKPDRFIISGLIFSEKLLSSAEQLVPSWEELIQYVNETYERTIQYSLNTILILLPLCILLPKLLDCYLGQVNSRRCRGKTNRSVSESDVDYVYFDIFHPGGVSATAPSQEQKHDFCKGCNLIHFCTVTKEFFDCTPLSRA